MAHECAPTNKQPAEPEVAHGAAVLQLCAPERPISLVLLLLLLLILLCACSRDCARSQPLSLLVLVLVGRNAHSLVCLLLGLFRFCRRGSGRACVGFGSSSGRVVGRLIEQAPASLESAADLGRRSLRPAQPRELAPRLATSHASLLERHE